MKETSDYQTAERRHFPRSKKREIIDYYLSHDYSKQYVWRKFTGDASEHGKILAWMRQLGYMDAYHSKKCYLAPMKDSSTPRSSDLSSHSNDTKIDQQSARIAELERLLAASERERIVAEIKADAYLEMVLLAESNLNIPIRKKYNTKSSKL